MRAILAMVALVLACGAARADVTIGAVLSLTGPAASLGIPARNTIELLPTTMAGQRVRWVVLDDQSDTTAAVRAARKLIDEEHADLIIGPSNTPNSLALLDVIGPASTPMVSLSGSGAVIEPPGGNKAWAFKLVTAERVAADQLSAHMAAHGVKSVAFIGFSNPLGDAYIAAMKASAEARGLQTLVDVRYNPTDTSVTPQALRLIQAKPDAVFVGGSGTPGIAPMIELRARGYTGAIYTVQGIANPDVLRLGGHSLDGMVFSAVPLLVAEQLPDGNAAKASALTYVRAYEGKYGPGSRSLFGATLWDAFLVADAGAKAALAAGQPGTPAFRTALRDAMQSVRGLPGAEAIFNMSPTDHSGADPASQVLVTVKDGTWAPAP